MLANFGWILGLRYCSTHRFGACSNRIELVQVQLEWLGFPPGVLELTTQQEGGEHGFVMPSIGQKRNKMY